MMSSLSETKILGATAVQLDLSALAIYPETVGGAVVRELVDIVDVRALVGAKQAEIDRLMLEYCPGEMSAEQMATWEASQRVVLGSCIGPAAAQASAPVAATSDLNVKPWRDRIDADGTYRHSGKLPNGIEFQDCLYYGDDTPIYAADQEIKELRAARGAQQQQAQAEELRAALAELASTQRKLIDCQAELNAALVSAAPADSRVTGNAQAALSDERDLCQKCLGFGEVHGGACDCGNGLEPAASQRPATAPVAVAAQGDALPVLIPRDRLQNWIDVAHDKERSMGDRLQSLSSIFGGLLRGDAVDKYPLPPIREQQPVPAATSAPGVWVGTISSGDIEGDEIDWDAEFDRKVVDELPQLRVPNQHFGLFMAPLNAAGVPHIERDTARLDLLEQMANEPEGILLHDGGDFTGRRGLGLRRIGRTLRQAIDAITAAEQGETRGAQ